MKCSRSRVQLLLLGAAFLLLIVAPSAVDAKKKKRKRKKSTGKTPSAFDKINAEPDPQKRIDLYSKQVRLHPEDKKMWLGRGLANVKKNFYPAAVKDFRKIRDLDPDYDSKESRVAIMSLANCYAKMSRHEEGIMVLSGLIDAVGEEAPKALLERCRIFSGMGQKQKAVKDCSDVINGQLKDLEPEAQGWAYATRAPILMAGGKVVEALADFTAGIEVWGDSLPALTQQNKADESPAQRELRSLHFYQGDLLCAGECGGLTADAAALLKEHRDLEGAVESYSYVINSPLTTPGTTNFGVTANRRGLARMWTGKLEEAKGDLEAAVSAVRNETAWQINLGLVLTRLNMLNAAYEVYTRSMEAPDVPETAFFNRGIVNQRVEDWDEAIADFTQALSLENTAGATLHRAFCYKEKGLTKQALRDTKSACKLGNKQACQYDSAAAIEAMDLNKDLEDCVDCDVEEVVEEVEAEEGEEEEAAAAAAAVEAAPAAKKEAKKAQPPAPAPPSQFYKGSAIKHIRDKNLKPFRKKFPQSFILFHKSDDVCANCGPIKEVFAAVAAAWAAKPATKGFSFGAIECPKKEKANPKGAAAKACAAAWGDYAPVDASNSRSASKPRLVFFGDGGWGEGRSFSDPLTMGDDADSMSKFVEVLLRRAKEAGKEEL